jgi:hypothetical protein
MTTTIPADFGELLLEALLEGLRSAAEDVERCGLDAEAYPEPLEQFDRIRAALDAINWGAGGDIDIENHRLALQQALSDRLRTERHMRASAEADADERGRQRAHGYARQIEAFMTEAGLGIVEP